MADKRPPSAGAGSACSALGALSHLQGVVDLDSKIAEMFSCTFALLSAESGYVLKIR
jgi:hypothetical protein